MAPIRFDMSIVLGHVFCPLEHASTSFLIWSTTIFHTIAQAGLLQYNNRGGLLLVRQLNYLRVLFKNCILVKKLHLH